MGRTQMIFLSLQLAPIFGCHNLLWEMSKWPKHGCALRKPSLPCVKQETKGDNSTRGRLFSLVSMLNSCLPMVALPCFWGLQSSYKGETPLTSPSGSPGSLVAANSLFSCGWRGRGVETSRLSHRNLIPDVWEAW